MKVTLKFEANDGIIVINPASHIIVARLVTRVNLKLIIFVN